jgi:hypothetical protein
MYEPIAKRQTLMLPSYDEDRALVPPEIIVTQLKLYNKILIVYLLKS